MAHRGRAPEFQPKRRWAEALRDVLEKLSGLVQSISELLELVRSLEPDERRAAGAGLVGLLGAALTGGVWFSDAIAAPTFVYLLVLLGFQGGWVRRALASVHADSVRRGLLYGGDLDEKSYEERIEKTRGWRHALASSLVGPLKTPLGNSDQVAADMESTVIEVAQLTGYPLALVLVRQRRGIYSIVRTAGEVSDCLKEGTSWRNRDMNMYEYVARRSLYPHHLVEREWLGDSEYFLIAAAEIDVIGKAKLAVLDCFYDVVQHGIGRMEALGDG